MKLELEEAAKYLVVYLREAKYSEEEVSRFSEHFIKHLEEKYSNCWHPKEPLRGNGFRCLQTLGQTNLDPTLRKIFDNAKVEFKPFLSCLPQDLTMWIDPGDVSVRAGNRFAPIVSIYNESGECPYADKVLKRSNENRPYKVTKFYKARSHPSLPPTRHNALYFENRPSKPWLMPMRSASSSPPVNFENLPPNFDNLGPFEYNGYPSSRIMPVQIARRNNGAADLGNGMLFEPTISNGPISRQTSPIFTSAPPHRYIGGNARGFAVDSVSESFSQPRTSFNHGFHSYIMPNNPSYQPCDVYTPNVYFNNVAPVINNGIGDCPLAMNGPAFDMYLPPDLNGTAQVYPDEQTIIQQLAQPASSAAVNSCFYPLSVR